MTTIGEYECDTTSDDDERISFRIGGLGGLGTIKRPFLAWKVRTNKNAESYKGRIYLDQIAAVTSGRHTMIVLVPETHLEPHPVFWAVRFAGNNKSFEVVFIVDASVRDWLHNMTVEGAL